MPTTRKKPPAQRRAKPARKAVVGTPHSRALKVTKRSRIRQRVGLDDFEPRPSHFRILQAFAAVMDSGGPVNWQAVARAAGVSREYLWKIRRRYPGLEPWLMEQARLAGERLAGAIFQKLGVMALRGSVPHAELFYRVLGVTSNRAESVAGVAISPSGPTVINIAVPRPGDPPVASSEKTIHLPGGASGERFE